MIMHFRYIIMLLVDISSMKGPTVNITDQLDPTDILSRYLILSGIGGCE
jgi:hypothetical protein